MASLAGRTVLTLEARMPSQLGSLFERHGARVVVAPALQEVPLPSQPEVTALIDALCDGQVGAMVFMTGVGAEALLKAAEDMGRKEQLVQSLASTRIVCRGPKPVAVMRAHQVPVELVAPEPYTSQSLLAALQAQGWELQGKTVGLQHYGEVNTFLRDALQGMEANVMEVSLYGWGLPEDLQPLQDAIRAIVAGDIDVAAFTTQIQVRHMLQVAQSMGMESDLKHALHNLVVAPVGPVCARALEAEGIVPHLVPEHPKMGYLVLAVAEYFERLAASAPVS